MNGWFGGAQSSSAAPRREADEDEDRAPGSGSQARGGNLKRMDPFLADDDAGNPEILPRQLSDASHREQVSVRVYDLGKTFMTRGVLNSVAKSYGAFHSGIEVYGREWSFGMTFNEWSTGVTWNPPGLNADHTFRETIAMGFTTYSPEKVWKILEELKKEWLGCTYHILTRNCHHFSDTLLRRLGCKGLPPWLNDLAESGAATVEFLDSADSGYDGGEALVDFFDSVKNTVYYAFGGTPDPESMRPGQNKNPLPSRTEVVPTSMAVVPATD
eukprot:CAMPEP_0178397488 /NCGR_PEP_ID=MMETSP0689_2-20121128/14273_1 /TAXON_ID=160604 /ORGANISM="Amphidinium massartii, Strain CS-259" /LENGTH=270 /DNA_ID=CAMNT_0020018201 /DNA_START=145 /DNA_END=954 /DNA_ORIENTATION=+